MECYHYVNIFETKGLEYILVIIFLITLVLFMRHLVPSHADRQRPRHVMPNGDEPLILDTSRRDDPGR